MDFNNVPPKAKVIRPNSGKIMTIIIAAVIIIFALILISTCWYTVNDKEQGVVTTFGKVTSITDAGMHFKLPFGIQNVDKVQTHVYQKIEIGYRSDTTDSTKFEVFENESKMITGDYNIVNVDFFIEFKVNDPVKFLYSSYTPQEILKNLVQSQIRNVIGSTSVDAILTIGKTEIQNQVISLVTGQLEQYDIGLVLTDVKIQDSEPPTEEVIEAFKAVETAKQSAETAVNQAKAYENSQLPMAEAEADKLIQNAEFLKQKRINEATQLVAMFTARYTEYALNPEITRKRMYYEALQEALPGVKLYIDAAGSGSSTQMLLPLESFVNNSASSQG